MSETEETANAEKRERPEETEDKAEEPPSKQQKVSDDSKVDDGKTAEEDDKVAPAAVEPTSEETKTAEGKVVEETPEPKVEPANDAEKTTETVDTPAPAPAVEEVKAPAATAPVPVPAAASAPAAPDVPTAANASSVPAGLPPLSASNPDAPVEERGTVSALYVGRVIGKGGEMIRDLQARSSCRIDVDQNVPQGQPRVITYRGTRRTVDFAKKLVHMLCQENASETDLPLGEAKREFLIVPASSVGKIIGRGGEMIRELQARSQAKIQVDHNSHNGMDQQKHVTMTGTPQAVTKAKEMILFLVANPLMDAMQSINMLVEDKLQRGGIWGSGPPYPNLPNMGQNMQPELGAGAGGGGYGYDQQPHYGGYQAPPAHQPYAAAPTPYAAAPTPYAAPPQAYQQPVAATPYGQYGVAAGGGGTEIEVFYAAKNFMGRIIGSKGVTINDLQRRSGADLQINQDVPPGRECEITIRGPRPAIETAKQMLREIIEVGPNHPYAGGGPPANSGGYQQGAYGQQPGPYGHQNQQQGGYNQGYGQSYGQQPQAYNQGYQAPTQAYQQPHAPYQQTPAPYAPLVAAPVSEWKSASSPDGQVYYYNERTGQTQWEKPLGMP